MESLTMRTIGETKGGGRLGRRTVAPLGAAALFTLGIGVSTLPIGASAQSASNSRLTLQSGSYAGKALVSKDAFGKPCADVEAASKARVSNPNVFEHIVSVQNRCLKPLKLRFCYFGSDRCTDLDLPGLKRKDLVLGVYPGLKTFRYSWTEIR
ncbi:hypothetical protein [Rhodoplanes sp. SY1]|uniref:hypothetical protein n=1 Tax=Rhodoplanes sp. SY1 TaxID=3166646 RepID=UPI0038B63106